MHKSSIKALWAVVCALLLMVPTTGRAAPLAFEYDFFFFPNNPGTIGGLELGVSQATSLVFGSGAASFELFNNPRVLIKQNSFTVPEGVIVQANFEAVFTNPVTGESPLLILSGGETGPIVGSTEGGVPSYPVQFTNVPSPTPVPLPATGLLMLMGLGGMAALRRRARGKQDRRQQPA